MFPAAEENEEPNSELKASDPAWDGGVELDGAEGVKALELGLEEDGDASIEKAS